MTRLAGTDLDVHPLCLGGNVWGWTANERESFAVLDAYAAAGGNFFDSADVYSAWVPGNSGGESEEIIGRWLAARGNRDDVVVATKIGMVGGLTAANIREKTDASLRRLQVDSVDVLYAHKDDEDTPLEESLAAFDELIRAGKTRYIGASVYSAPRLAEALAVSEREGLARFAVLQTEYNLVRRGYEDGLRAVVEGAGIAMLSYYSLAEGFLTGKYRPGTGVVSARAEAASAYLDERGRAVIEALDEVAAAHAAPVAAVALAWLAAQATVAAPVASARTPEQLSAILRMVDLRLEASEVAALTQASDA